MAMIEYNNTRTAAQNKAKVSVPPLLAPVQPPVDTFADDLTKLYGNYNRTPTAAEIDSHRMNPGGLAAIDTMLKRDSQPAPTPVINGNFQQAGQEWLRTGGRTVADLQNFFNANPQYGATMGGSKGDKVTIGGHTFDAVIGAGAGGQGGSWSDITNGGNEPPSSPGFPLSSYAAQYSDPSTKRLEEFINQRISGLQAPAYTGPEQEILRTQALEPIERDRTASRQRALENIGSRGFDPTSGIAQELLSLVDRGYDTQRATSQNDLASKQINERRGREQEVQQLLTLLYDLPNQSIQQALAVMGMGPSPQSLFNQYGQLGQLQNQGQQQNAQWWGSMGQMLASLFPE